MSRGRRCRIGKPCGATCISRSKTCRVDLISELSDDVGSMRNSVSERGSVGSGESRDYYKEANEQYQKDFLNHVEQNSAGYSNATFKPMDLAELMVQASNQLDGEAKDNLRRLMEFVPKDGQVLFVSTFKPPENTRDLKTVTKFAELLEKSYPMLQLRFKSSIERIRELKQEERAKKREDRERVKQGLNPMHSQRLQGIRAEIDRNKATLKEARDKLFKAGVTYSQNRGNWGFTSPGSKRIVITDRSSLPPDKFVVGQRADAKLVSKQMRETMEFRANTPRMTDEEQLRTKFVAGRFAEGKTNSAYLYVYAHELGHQIHYRSGSTLPPADSVTNTRGTTLPHSNRGISQYSKTDEKETFAEAFAAFIFNPAALREQDAPMYNWVKSSFERAIENAGAPVRGV